MKRKVEKWFDSAIVKEKESNASSHSREFVMNNKTRKAVFSSTCINYYDSSDQQWKELDSSLKAVKGGYQAKLGNYTVKLSKQNNECVEVTDGTGCIAWEYIGTNKNIFAKGSSHTSPEKRASKLKIKAKIPGTMNLGVSGHAVYENAEGDVDLDYSIEGGCIKENIIVKEKSDTYAYYFSLRVSNFAVKMAENGEQIAFYKQGAGADGAEHDSPEFVMQKPFMYDAAGYKSEAVHYALESVGEGCYVFSVKASAEWVNAPERVFPVYIDPPLSLSGSSYVSLVQRRYRWCTNCDVCYDFSHWEYMDNPFFYNYIELQNDGSTKTTALLNIQKSGINFARSNILSAKLVFQKYGTQVYSGPVNIKVGNNLCTYTNESQLTVDITNYYRAYSDDFSLEMELPNVGTARRFTKYPVLMVEYQPQSDYAVRKTFPITAGVDAELDIMSGNATIAFDDISDPVLGVSVSHIYKPNDEFSEYGNNFRLNLDEKLEKTGASSTGEQYAYTDAMGDKHTFKEHFYYIGDEGEKVYVTSNTDSIYADTDGRLWWNMTEVFRELTTDRGLRAASRLSSVNNSEWVEQRMDEEKQLEEQLDSYESSLLNFVLVSKETGEVTETVNKAMLISPDRYEAFISRVSPCSCLLPKEESLSYKSLFTQKASLATSKTALELQLESLENNATSLLYQYNSPDTLTYQSNSCALQEASLPLEKYEVEHARSVEQTPQATCSCNGPTSTEPIALDETRAQYYTNKLALIGEDEEATTGATKWALLNQNKGIITAQKNIWERQKALIAGQIYDFQNYYFNDCYGPSSDIPGTLTLQYRNTQKQLADLAVQVADIDKQLALFAEKSAKYITQLNKYYKEYQNLKKQLETLKMQMPVCYLLSDGGAKGFNADGVLVLVQDKHGHYITVEREIYALLERPRISAIHDGDNHSMKFLYNASNQLVQITNSLGQRTTFKYDATGDLVGIGREHLPNLTIAYSDGEVHTVSSSDNVDTEVSYTLTHMLEGIVRRSSVDKIAHGIVSQGSTPTTLSSVYVDYTTNETKLHYDTGKVEIYRVNQNTELVTAYYELTDNKVSFVERYAYSGGLRIKAVRAHKDCLDVYPYSTFAYHFDIETVETASYNSFDEPIVTTVGKYAIPRVACDLPVEETKVEYTYDDERHLTERRTTHTYLEDGIILDLSVTVEKLYYNDAGEIVRRESFVEGEELTTGITVEERLYNDKGYQTQSFTYNSLDPTSKLYKESEPDEKGNAVATFDETGAHKTAFILERDGASVRSECLPNRSVRSFGRAKDGTVVAVTHSTETGEGNSNTALYTCDLLTEVKSGNNTVRYEYDSKRRMSAVSLNGVEDYVTYSYSGEGTDNETVTATRKDGSTVSTVKNRYGNTKSIACGDRTVTNEYDEHQALLATIDSVSGTTEYEYDGEGNLTYVTAGDYSESYTYDGKKRLVEKTLAGRSYQYAHKQTAAGELESVTVDGSVVRPATDALGRNAGKSIEVDGNKIAEEKISYVKCGDHATSMPSTVRFATNGVFKESIQYKYDSMGNIVQVFENGKTACRYEYDALGRLTREDNLAFGKTTTWAYDNNGNIIAKYEYAITAKPTSELHLLDCIYTPYAYADNSDQLLSYGDEAFVYDTIGNPTTYRGKAATWAYGRQLTAYDGNTFAYDARGRRTAKNALAFTYDSSGNLIGQSNGLEFLYDHTGVFAVKHDGSTYFYRKNAQNDVIALLDTSGATVVKYRYDAWGNCITTVLNEEAATVAALNPFRYRSYYYDCETGLYYLSTRYYDPEVGRFITIDDISYLDPDTVNGLNLYAYCLNNPLAYFDPTGHIPEWLKWLGIGLAMVGAVLVVGAVTVLTCGVGTALAGTMAGAVIYGAAQGIVIGAAVGVVAGGVIGGALTGWSAEGILIGMGIGLGGGSIIGGLIGGFAGASSFAANSAYITQNGEVARKVLSSFKGNPKLKNIASGTKVNRYWGGTAREMGRWVSPNMYSNPINSLALNPAWGNTASNLSTFVFNQNATVLVGKAAAQGALTGGGIQWFIGNVAWLALL